MWSGYCMHLAWPNFCNSKGSGVWGDKSHVLFVNDKAIISLYFIGGKKSYSKDSKQGSLGRQWNFVGLEKCFFFPSWEQTNGHWEQQTLLRRSYWQTHWQPAPKKVLSNLGRETVMKGRGMKKRHKMRGKEKEERRKNKSKPKVKRQEREQRGWWWDERKDKLDPQRSSLLRLWASTAEGMGLILGQGIKTLKSVACKKIFKIINLKIKIKKERDRLCHGWHFSCVWEKGMHELGVINIRSSHFRCPQPQFSISSHLKCRQ